MDVKKSPENSPTTKIGEYIPSGFLMSTISSFKNIEINMIYTEVNGCN